MSLEYAGQNSQDAMRIMKGGNAASYRNPCKSPNGRVPAGYGFLGVVFSAGLQVAIFKPGAVNQTTI